MSQFEEKTDVNEEEDTTLSNSEVVTKYLEAGKIANSTLNEIIALSVPGANIADICRAGDLSILAKVDNIYKPKKGRKNVEKGIAFPVCLSVNDCVCHNSPLASDPAVILAVGDVVKVDLGVHVDGYIAVVAHTFVVSGPTENGEIQPITGPLADVVNAAYAAAEIAAKTIRPGNTNKQVTDAVKCAAETYGVRAVAGTLMHQMKRYVIDAAKVILLREEPEHRVEECTFEVNEVYSVDVAMTTGDGRPREQDSRTTIFKRNVDRNYNLKMKASRTLYSEINKKYPTLPFTLRSVEDERQAKLGIKELVQHELLTPYPVLFERTGAFVAHIKFTILLLPNGNTKITGLDFVPGTFVSSDDKVLPEAARELLATSSKKKKPKKKKANTESATTTEGTTETSQEGTEGS